MTIERTLFFAMFGWLAAAYYAKLPLFGAYVPIPPTMAGKDHSTLQLVEILYRILLSPSVILLWFKKEKAYARYLRKVLSFVGRMFAPPPGTDIKTSDVTLDGVLCRVYVPETLKSSGAVLYFHGGGFVLNDIEVYDRLAREIARQACITVILVEYRRAPEYRFPAAVVDCEKVALYVLEGGATQWNINPKGVIVAGDSAGGNLAAVVSQRIRKKPHLPPIKAQVLIYPNTQLHNFALPCHKVMAPYNRLVVNSKSVATWMLMYLGLPLKFVPVLMSNGHLNHRSELLAKKFVSEKYIPRSFLQGLESESHPEVPKVSNALQAAAQAALEPFLSDPDFVPLVEPNLAGLPPAFVLTAGFDILRDEGLLYAKRLEEAGVLVVQKHYPEGFHGMIMAFNAFELSKLAFADTIQFIEEHSL